MRVALSNMALNTGSNSPADALITLSTSAVAVSRSSASSRSRRSCANSPSAPAVEELLRRDAGAEPRFGIASRLRALASLLLALERRRIAHPKGLGLRRFSKGHYIRDLRPAKWGSGVSLHGSI